MAAIANNPAFAKKVGVPQSVGKDFSKADKGRKFAQGGEMKESKAMVGKEMNFMKKKGAPASMIKHEAAEMGAMKKGSMMKYAEGGKMPMKDGKPAFIGDGKGEMKMGGMAKAKKMMGGGIESKGKTKGTMIKMAAGGFVSKADGVAQRGKTKATQIKMNKGGYC